MSDFINPGIDNNIAVTKLREKFNYIVHHVSKKRWLSPEELDFIMSSYSLPLSSVLGLYLSNDKSIQPKDGDFFIFSYESKHQTAKFNLLQNVKNDGVQWAKKPNMERTKEYYYKLNINGIPTILAIHYTAEYNKNFRRRIYRLLDDSNCYALSHYRECSETESVTALNKMYPSFKIYSSTLTTTTTTTPSPPQSHSKVNTSHSEDISDPLDPFADFDAEMFFEDVSDWTSNEGLFKDSSNLSPSLETQQSSNVNSSGIHGNSTMIEPNITSSQHPQYMQYDSHNTSPRPGELFSTDIHNHPQNQHIRTQFSQISSQTYPPHQPMVPRFHQSHSSNSTDLNSCVFQSQPMQILDFAPMKGNLSGGEKLIICINDPSGIMNTSGTLYVLFGTIPVAAESIMSGVIRCISPSSPGPTKCNLSLVNSSGITVSFISPNATSIFEYFSSNAEISNVPNSFFTTQQNNGNTISPFHFSSNNNGSSNFAENIQQYIPQPVQMVMQVQPNISEEEIKTKSQQNIPRKNQLQNLFDNDAVDFDVEREHKIRIVEKLSTVNTALSTEKFDGSKSPGSRMRITPRNKKIKAGDEQHKSDKSISPDLGLDWLDEGEISALSVRDFEVTMDKYVVQVVNQLVQLAAVDQDLQSELDELDTFSGLSLLHYCCMYKLTALVDILVEKGASVNIKSACGHTALHIASGAGYTDIVDILIKRGGDVRALNAQNNTPLDCAVIAGRRDVIAFFKQIDVNPSIPDIAGNDGGSDIHLLNSKHSPNAASFHLDRVDSMMGGESNECFDATIDGTFSHGWDSASDLGSQSPLQRGEANNHSVPNINVNVSPMDFPGSRFSTVFLQETFSSLSLADKCALSLSMAHPIDGSLLFNSSTAIGPKDTDDSNVNSSFVSLTSDTNDISRAESSIDFEIQSVISEIDKESLDVAMSMMGESELLQVEGEVKKIQSNVRAWILRKNYINLRDSAKILQGFWRERRKGVALHHTDTSIIARPYVVPVLGPIHSSDAEDNGLWSPSLSSMTQLDGMIIQDSVGNGDVTHLFSGPFDRTGILLPFREISSNSVVNELERKTNSERQVNAAATLQAVTRGMLARKSFRRIRRQAMASIVIQKSFVNWWAKKGNF